MTEREALICVSKRKIDLETLKLLRNWTKAKISDIPEHFGSFFVSITW